MYKYADDTSVIVAGGNNFELSSEATTMSHSMKVVYRKHAGVKCRKKVLIVFDKGNKNDESLYVRLVGESVESKWHIKFLGVMLDSRLSCDTHVDTLNRSICGIIR